MAASRGEQPSALLRALLEFFQLLVEGLTVKDAEAVVRTVWKSYWECFLEDLQAPKRLSNNDFSGLVDIASVAVLDSLRAARGVTKRAWGCKSCVDQRAMDEERARQRTLLEGRKREAVGVARERVAELGLETMTDPEAFLRLRRDAGPSTEAAGG
ncbi:unnamed protein product [Prorocentrum cordatum]|uniref:Uncharacterized protein n=1 Tax=Prorocentrum cordatum TaxID=2364126 RepID=A0ABN9TA76_9DINO|nr:unnamed protein product [Polarella glacialis]